MDLEVFDSPDHAKEEKVTPMTGSNLRFDVFKEQSPSNVLARVLSKLAT